MTGPESSNEPAKRTLLLTTPIYYVNDVPHVGHAYTTIAADALTRARRLAGHDVFFLTGTDEHGQNIERIAREQGHPGAGALRRDRGRLPRALGAARHPVRPLHPHHRGRSTGAGVLKLWERLREAKTPDGRDAVYQGTYSGWYCPRCEGFKDEEELRQPGNVCPDHERPCEWTEEENFFFRLSAYEDWLRETIDSDRLLIRPESRKNEILGVIRQGLKDFSVSRARVKWGIPVPEEPDHVLYVWIDALSNYITALGFADDGRELPPVLGGRGRAAAPDRQGHHPLPLPLLAGDPARRGPAGADPRVRPGLHHEGRPQALEDDGQRHRSRSRSSSASGPTPRATSCCARPPTARTGTSPTPRSWSATTPTSRTTSGNLVSRALTMVAKYCDGKGPGARPRPRLSRADRGLEEELQDDAPVDWRRRERPARTGCSPATRRSTTRGALGEVWSWISQLNQRIVQVEPWSLAKDPARRGELDGVPLPAARGRPPRGDARLARDAAARRAGSSRCSGLGEREPGPDDLDWGRLEPGAPLGAVVPLFPRVGEGQKQGDHRVRDTPPPHLRSRRRPTPAHAPRSTSRTSPGWSCAPRRSRPPRRSRARRSSIKLQVDLGSRERGRSWPGSPRPTAPRPSWGRRSSSWRT